MERRYLTAKRRCGNKDFPRSNPETRSQQSVASIASVSAIERRSPISDVSPGTTKNIADARMKRLREALAKDRNERIETPPPKRFASDILTPPHQPPAKISKRSPGYKSPRKHFSPPHKAIATISPSSSRQSVNKRLKEAATSTPITNRRQHSNSFYNSDQNLSFTQFVQNNQNHSASSSGIGLLNDDDFNNTNLSSSTSNNHSINLGNSSLSNVSLYCHANDSTREIEDMDWSPVCEETLLSNIRELRETLFEAQNQQPIVVKTNTTSLLKPLNSANTYVIVDTNIFIDKLQTVINIMHIAYSDDSQPVIYVPWMVLQELDYFKDGYSLSEKHPISKIIQTRCRKAVKFINECLLAHKSNFKGQPVQRAAVSRAQGHSADDSILSCCVQLFSEGYEVILLSSDTNLRNKAMISNIRAFAPTEIIKELKTKPLKTRFNFVEEISKRLALICSFILHFEMKSHYGEAEYKKLQFKELPWQFRDCIKYLRDHFDPVFRSHVPKQCRKVVDDLYELIFVNEAIVNEIKFTEVCLSLLIYLQTGLPKYEANIHNTIQEIKQLESDFFDSSKNNLS